MFMVAFLLACSFLYPDIYLLTLLIVTGATPLPQSNVRSRTPLGGARMADQPSRIVEPETEK